ncbi:hypothetical protein [Nonomuraea sp. NPDC050783]|uniref:hypothetical protein n=1 Tax=Nonomuraea sp. NPDC050783 TaxID=3154634 RepID=UPI00346568E4
MSSFTDHRFGRRAGQDGFRRALRAEWAAFRAARSQVLAVAASVLVTVSLGLLIAGGVRSTCVTGKGEGACPAPLVGPDGTAVRDKYYFVHRPLKGNGDITARVTDMTGQIRRPDVVPGVRNVEQGVVPWAKAGLLIRQSLRRGTPYAAVMLTGAHGVRMQHDYVHDVPGGPHNGPQWLRLARAGDVVTGYESDDGRAWAEIGRVRLAGLPESVEVGLFATSPGVLWGTAKAFSQVTATFDQIALRGAHGPWRHDDVGVGMKSDGTTPHHPGGAVESGGTLVVTGNGDIGPVTVEGGMRADLLLVGGAVGLIPLLVAAAASVTAKPRRAPSGPAAGPTASLASGPTANQASGPTANQASGPASGPAGRSSPAGRCSPAGGSTTAGGSGTARVLLAKAVVVGVASFVAGLVASGVVVPAGLALLRAHRNPVQPITLGTELRVVVGYAALSAAAAVLALGLAALVRRVAAATALATALATVLAVALVVVPHLLAIGGLMPWLSAITPAAGFAITQSIPAFAHVDVDPSPITGYYPLAPWAGLAVTCGYAAVALGAAIAVSRSARRAG